MTRQKEILSNFVAEYQDGKLSVLVGAGFSMNVSPLYLNWGELLMDMYEYLYADDIKQYLSDIQNSGKTNSQDEIEKIKYDFIKNRISKEDLLELVSKYIKAKGRRESVEIYIEDHTPIVKLTENKIELNVLDKKEIISNNDLSAHYELLKCNRFRNIYP